MAKPTQHHIEAARKSFNQELLSDDYPSIHGDTAQVARLIGFLDPQTGGRYLDLGTGMGAVAFALATQEPGAEVIGLDIADQAIARNREVARDQGLANLAFENSDGRGIDFADDSFDGIASRFALHHFPEVHVTLAELRRVLKPDGTLAIADAIRHPDDGVDFVNRFQALKPDGHIEIYRPEALVALFHARGFLACEEFVSELAFSRALNDANRALIEATPPETLALYDLRIEGDQAALKFDILNVKFQSA